MTRGLSTFLLFLLYWSSASAGITTPSKENGIEVKYRNVFEEKIRRATNGFFENKNGGI